MTWFTIRIMRDVIIARIFPFVLFRGPIGQPRRICSNTFEQRKLPTTNKQSRRSHGKFEHSEYKTPGQIDAIQYTKWFPTVTFTRKITFFFSNSIFYRIGRKHNCQQYQDGLDIVSIINTAAGNDNFCLKTVGKVHERVRVNISDEIATITNYNSIYSHYQCGLIIII